mgnify:CR=1 FL=1
MKLASYNIRKARGLDQKRSPERVLDVVSRLGADVVVLQEADVKTVRPESRTIIRPQLGLSCRRSCSAARASGPMRARAGASSSHWRGPSCQPR